MNIAIPLDEAGDKFTTLIARVREGEAFTIIVDGEAVAQISPVEPPPVKRRVPGSAKGEFTVPDSFFDPLPGEIASHFES